MTKHLRLLIVSGLIFSFIYPHTIYFTEEVDGEIVDKVVKDVLYLGIKDSKIYYYNKYVTVDINCKDVYQIVDNNDEVMEFSCSDSTYNPKLFISEKNVRKNQKLTVVTNVFATSCIVFMTIMWIDLFHWDIIPIWDSKYSSD